jgi:glycosyltransferase involved in cell wall biosynthesis
MSEPHIVYLGRSRLSRSRANLIQLLHTASAFVQLGWRVRVYLPPWETGITLADKLRELDVDPAPEVVPARSLHPRFKFHPFVWLNLRMLRAAPILYTRVAGLSLALARAKLPHHLEVHDLERLIELALLSRVITQHRQGLIRTLIPISTAAADRLIHAGADPKRVHIAHSGVKLEAYAGLPPFQPQNLNRPRIVHLGKFSPERGSAVFQHLAKQCDITVVGPDASSLPDIKYHPAIPMREVPYWYGLSDLTLLPYQPQQSTAASMSPVKLFEALAAGRPIVASDLPTLREVLRHEHNALLVPPADLGQWSRAVERLRDDHPLALQLAANARETAKRYGWVNRASGIAQAIGLKSS